MRYELCGISDGALGQPPLVVLRKQERAAAAQGASASGATSPELHYTHLDKFYRLLEQCIVSSPGGGWATMVKRIESHSR